DAVREMTRLGARVVLDAEGEPLRRGIEAEPWLVSPNQHEAEQLVGQKIDGDDDFVMALDQIAEMGARNVHITMETGCFALVREERQVKRYRARAPEVDPVSVLGAGDVFLARWLAALQEGGKPEEALRLAVAAGSASVLEVGAGRFDPREATRLAGNVHVERLRPLGSPPARGRSEASASDQGSGPPPTGLVESVDRWSSSSTATR